MNAHSLKIDTTKSTEGQVPITLDAAEKTAGQILYQYVVKLSSQENSKGLINMREFAAKKVFLFVIDGTALDVTGTLESPEFVSNSDLGHDVNLTLTATSQFKTYPTITDYRVQLQLNNSLLDYTAMEKAVTEINASGAVTKANAGSQKFTAMYKVSAKSSDGLMVDIVKAQTLKLTGGSVTTTAVYVEPDQKDVMNITPMPDHCIVEFDIFAGERTPALSSGHCYIETKNKKNLTVKATLDNGNFTVKTNVTLTKPATKAWCDFGVDPKTNTSYMSVVKPLSTYNFYSYGKNPMTGAVKVDNDSFSLTSSGHVKNCHGEYDGTITAKCKNNDMFVKVFGDGQSWKYVDSLGNFSTSTAGYNFTEIVQTTCGSAAIFPAALIIAAVSLFNIFK